MPRIFDNIEQDLLPALQQTLEITDHADFCVGYFNLRGWKQLDRFVERWAGGEGHCCRLLVGMHRPPVEELRAAMGLAHRDGEIDNQTALRLKKKLAEDFREQLAIGTPTNEDEACLRRLARQIKNKKVVVKLFLRHPLHAKLYLLFRPDPIDPIVSYLGSSNLTMAGLSGQGELNVDVLDHDACNKLVRWFADRWDDRWCIDISAELAQIIDESWAREEPVRPYHIYLKMAYHLSQEARAGLNEFRIPRDFDLRPHQDCKRLIQRASRVVRIGLRNGRCCPYEHFMKKCGHSCKRSYTIRQLDLDQVSRNLAIGTRWAPAPAFGTCGAFRYDDHGGPWQPHARSSRNCYASSFSSTAPSWILASTAS